MNQFTAAAIQLDSQSNKEENLKQIVRVLSKKPHKKGQSSLQCLKTATM